MRPEHILQVNSALGGSAALNSIAQKVKKFNILRDNDRLKFGLPCRGWRGVGGENKTGASLANFNRVEDRKKARNPIISSLFMVAEAGLEPATSGL